MANDVNTTVINDGPRNYIAETRIVGDGSGEETTTSLIDVSGLDGAPSSVVIDKIYYSLTGFSIDLLWDATENTAAFQCIEGEGGIEFDKIGGPLRNDAGAGKTGDLLFTTVGLGSGDDGYIRLQCRKKYS